MTTVNSVPGSSTSTRPERPNWRSSRDLSSAAKTEVISLATRTAKMSVAQAALGDLEFHIFEHVHEKRSFD